MMIMMKMLIKRQRNKNNRLKRTLLLTRFSFYFEPGNLSVLMARWVDDGEVQVVDGNDLARYTCFNTKHISLV